MRALISALISLAMLSGCATAYTGPRPNFSKKGADAKVEYQKFEIGESYGDVNMYAVRMNNKLYFTDGVDSIARDVSPGWARRFGDMKVAHYVGWGFFGLALAGLFLPKNDPGLPPIYWVGLGGAIGTGIYINVTGMRAAEDYNRDLKSKFSPALAVSKTF